MNAVDAVQAAEFACHLALNDPKDDMARAMLLEVLANLKATPLASFPMRYERYARPLPLWWRRCTGPACPVYQARELWLYPLKAD